MRLRVHLHQLHFAHAYLYTSDYMNAYDYACKNAYAHAHAHAHAYNRTYAAVCANTYAYVCGYFGTLHNS